MLPALAEFSQLAMGAKLETNNSKKNVTSIIIEAVPVLWKAQDRGLLIEEEEGGRGGGGQRPPSWKGSGAGPVLAPREAVRLGQASSSRGSRPWGSEQMCGSAAGGEDLRRQVR